MRSFFPTAWATRSNSFIVTDVFSGLRILSSWERLVFSLSAKLVLVMLFSSIISASWSAKSRL